MTLDSEEQKKMLLEILSSIQIPGSAIDQIYKLKQDILKAEIKK